MKYGWILIILLPLIGCQPGAAEDELSGRVTLWHSWSAEDTITLESALALFEEIHPAVRVVSIAIPRDRILEEFIRSADDGLGPAMLIGNSNWTAELSRAGIIKPVSDELRQDSFMSNRDFSPLTNQDWVWGVPLSLEPRALYYNKELVDQPPETLDQWLAEAEAGKRIAFIPFFEEAYWGIQAFGEGLFDSQGRFTLDESGFEEWLRWLDEAQGSPGVILNVDDASLLELFRSGEVAYYVAGPEIQTILNETAGDERETIDYGVAPLPDGPHGPAGPLLRAETIFHYPFASADQARIAEALTEFLVNQQQSIRFMRETNRVPANPNIVVDRRIYPAVSGFARQARTAVVIPSELDTDRLTEAGDRAYVSVLSGALTPSEAVCEFGLEVASFQNYAAADIDL
ncbi:MAG: extracellular solute-binding protein, partial [Candidatus Promineifilaceae bacterium]|nr:extracellular solute-binding protein [Candidatus Promineifilaceae bacterium]